MKSVVVTSFALLVGVAGDTMAACPVPDMVYINASALVGLKVCAKRGNDQWQEELRPNGEVWDFKRGPNHPTDPSEKVGSWSIDAAKPKVITYNYGGGGTYSYRVLKKGKRFIFCGVNNSEEIDGIVVPNNIPCSQ